MASAGDTLTAEGPQKIEHPAILVPPPEVESETLTWLPPTRLALLTVLAFLPVIGCGWVNWDDDGNFLRNPNFRGLGWANIAWAWKTTLLGVYQPLGWMLYEAEYAAWGMNARGYHIVSLAFHAANAAALYCVTVALLKRALPQAQATALRGPSALAVALCMAHPLRTEPVAWLSCQSYLPSVFCMLLALLAYLRSNEPARNVSSPQKVGWLAASLGLLFVAVLFKPVAMTFPAVLVLLDIYPLKRVGWGGGWNAWVGPEARRVWLEKVPFVALGFVFALIAMRSKPAFDDPFGYRLATACYSVWFYPIKTLVPTSLSVVYMHQIMPDILHPKFLACAVALVAVTATAIVLRKRWPAFTAAWASYLLIIAPNSGLVRTIYQGAADRYSYFASMGLFVLVAGLLYGWSAHKRPYGRVVPAVGWLAVMGLCVLSWYQSATWIDAETLWRHALKHGAAESVVAETNLGEALSEQGRYEEALPHYAKAVALHPELAKPHQNLGLVLARLGELKQSVQYFLEAIRLNPRGAIEARHNLAVTLIRLDDLDGAEAQITEALRLRPDYAEAHNTLGRVLAKKNRREEAEAHFTEALRIRPDFPDAVRNLKELRSTSTAAHASPAG